MLHFAWVGILLVCAVHKDCIAPPPHSGQRSTWNTNDTRNAALTVKRLILMFHSTQTIDNTETSGLDISRYVFGTTRQANKGH